jgi:hypothetical protein
VRPLPERRAVRRRWAVLPLAAIAWSGAGCRLFTDPEQRPAPGGAWIGVEILQEDDLPGTVGLAPAHGGARIVATFSPGVDERGERRQPTSEELRVNGSGYPARSLTDGHVREWLVNVAPPADPDVALVIEPPRVIGHPVVPEAIRLTAVAKGGPDTVRVRRGESIRIPLQLPARAMTPAPPGRFWGFRLARQGETGSILTMSGNGVPPAELVVPAPFLEHVADSTLVASFEWRQQSVGVGIDDKPALYSVSVYATTRLVWRVELRP